MSVDKCGHVLLVICIHHGHQQRRFHVHSAVESEYRGKPVLDDVIEGRMLWRLRLKII